VLVKNCEVSPLSEEFVHLSPLQLDALREIGNVGAGNAATALSQLINKKINMTVPRVSVAPISEVPDLVGGAERLVAGVFLRVFGEAPGSILFLLPRESAFALVDTLIERPNRVNYQMSELDESALKEIGNILASAYLNAFEHFTRISLLPSIPALAIDMAGAILSLILIQLGQVGDYALVIETEFSAGTGNDDVCGHFFLIPDPGSLATILNAIGVKENV
jgi:chemotaxis protein CheC